VPPVVARAQTAEWLRRLVGDERSGTPEPAGSLKDVRDLLMDLAGAA
jgi:hypothetical protein